MAYSRKAACTPLPLPIFSMPKKAGTAVSSDMQPRPIRIHKYRRTDLQREVFAANRIKGPQLFADPLGATFQQAQANPVAQRGGETDRGHMAFHVFRADIHARNEEMGAGTQALFCIHRLETGPRRSQRITQ